MTRMFEGDTIPGLVEALTDATHRLAPPDKRDRPKHGWWIVSRDTPTASNAVELDVLVAEMERLGFSGPRVRDHIEWLVVNDPYVVRNGKRIRAYRGTS